MRLRVGACKWVKCLCSTFLSFIRSSLSLIRPFDSNKRKVVDSSKKKLFDYWNKNKKQTKEGGSKREMEKSVCKILPNLYLCFNADEDALMDNQISHLVITKKSLESDEFDEVPIKKNANNAAITVLHVNLSSHRWPRNVRRWETLCKG